ncbi:unnamed protein product [Calypogeia fissa]
MARKREVALVVLGVVLHSAYMLSIFDIYFKTPIVHGMDPVSPRIEPPAKRLVLFIADGLRADKFFELEADSRPRAPYLHSIIHNKGRWGVSHARPPTESRPGHVAIIAGFYEDPSAVTKGWKANPVEFDSVFNRSRLTVSYGSPDIVPIFCGGLTNTLWDSYSHEYEDFASDASFLDEWAFDKLGELLNRSRMDSHLKASLDEGGLIIFLHLLGCDTNGHAHRPYSPIYLDNIRLVDKGVASTVKLIEDFFPDGETAYIFTADHGMSNKGSHGDGDPDCTETPLVAWGAGVRGPSKADPENFVDDDDFKFVDEHTHHMQTPPEWGLQGVERVDVNQADIAPLMSTLLGLPCPLNSVGILPINYLALDKRQQSEAVFANAKQVLNQVLRKSGLKQSTSLYFKPFLPLVDSKLILEQIDKLMARGQFDSAVQSGHELIALALKGLHYFQTYDWLFLMTTVVVGYIGWMLYILLHVLKTYTSITFYQSSSRKQPNSHLNSQQVRIAGGLLMGTCSVVLLIERSPPLYHVYLGLAMFFWVEILGDLASLRRALSALASIKISGLAKLLVLVTISFLILEFLVLSFFRREVYTGVFLVAGVVGAVVVSCNTPDLSMVPAFIGAACWSLSGFTLMPTQIPDNTFLVVGSGLLVVSLALLARWVDSTVPRQQFWRPLAFGPARTSDKSWRLFLIQLLLVVAASVMVWVTTSHRENKRKLPMMYQLLNWSIAGLSVVLPLKSPNSMLTRLSSIYLGFAPPFLLLSIGYEGLFYSALASVLLSWVLVESAVLFSPVSAPYSGASESLQAYDLEGKYLTPQMQHLKLMDVRVALCFLVLINVAFFGTGNVASVASFEISSVYRFITVFNPFIMGGLLLCKVFIPFILVTSAFSAVTRVLMLPRLGCYFIVLLLSDVMTIHFFFLVRNTGSWLDIGQTISHFGIMSAQVIFVLILFAITSIYTRDLEFSSQKPLFEATVGSKYK